MTRKIKILVLDDEESLSQSVSKSLRRKGYETLDTFNGHEAVRLFLEERPDICILDIDLHDSTISGIVVLEVVREIRKDVECIMLSGVFGEEMLEESKKKGCFDYIKKPIVPHILHESVDRAVECILNK